FNDIARKSRKVLSTFIRLSSSRQCPISHVHQKRRAEPVPSVWSAHGCERQSRGRPPVMKKIPVYVTPYDKVHFGPSTVMTLHRFGIFDPDVARRVPTLSPFSAKLTAHLRFQAIPFEPVAEQGVGNAPRGKVPFITVDGVKVADSELVIGFLKTAFPDPDAGLSDHQRAVGHLVQRTLEALLDRADLRVLGSRRFGLVLRACLRRK